MLIPWAEMLAALVMLKPFRGVVAPTLLAKVTIPVPAVMVKSLAPSTVFSKLKAPPFEVKVFAPAPSRMTGFLNISVPVVLMSPPRLIFLSVPAVRVKPSPPFKVLRRKISPPEVKVFAPIPARVTGLLMSILPVVVTLLTLSEKTSIVSASDVEAI